MFPKLSHYCKHKLPSQKALIPCFSSPQPFLTSDVSRNFPIQGMSCKWNLITFVLLWLAYFIYCFWDSFTLYHGPVLHSFSGLNPIPSYRYTPLTHSPSWALGLFLHFVMAKNASPNVGARVCSSPCNHFFRVYTPKYLTAGSSVYF